MKTAVRRVLLMSALMSPGALYALGLGEIQLNSALNQPFDAEIELVSATQEDLGALRASLASSDTFARYGLDRPGVPVRLQLPGRQGRRRQGHPARHLAAAGHRTVRDAAGRGQLAARPAAARIHRAARPAGLCARSGGERARCGSPPGQFGRCHQYPRVGTGRRNDDRIQPPCDPGQRCRTCRRPEHRAGQHLPGARQRHAVADRQCRQPGLALEREPRDGVDLPEQSAGVRRQHQRAAFRQHAAHTGREPDPAVSAQRSVGRSRAPVRRLAQRHDCVRHGCGREAGRLRLVTPEQGTTAPSTATRLDPGGGKAGTAAAAPRQRRRATSNRV